MLNWLMLTIRAYDSFRAVLAVKGGATFSIWLTATSGDGVVRPPKKKGGALVAETAQNSGRRNRRAEQRAETLRDIRQVALQQIRSQGGAALSLRHVAREVGLSSAGIYGYFPSRDDLLTDLVARAFDDLSAVIRTADEEASTDARTRVKAVVDALTGWASARPVEYALLFDSPIPGYAAPPAGPTVPAAQRYRDAVAVPLRYAWRCGHRHDASDPHAPADQSASQGPPPDDTEFLIAFARCWTRIHGVVSLTLHGHLNTLGLDQHGMRDILTGESDSLFDVLGI